MSDLAPALERHRIDATVVVQTVYLPDETPELLELAESDPHVAGVVGWTDLRAPDVSDRLGQLHLLPGAERLVGIRHPLLEEPDPRWLCRPDVRRGLRAVGAAGLAYDLVVTPEQLPAVIDTARALGELRFVLDHGGKPWFRTDSLDPWRTDVLELARLPNVAVKLSGLVTEADESTWSVELNRPYAEVLLDGFGPDRVMFGSDWPMCLLAASYDEVVTATDQFTSGLSGPELDAVFGATAVGWYRLPVSSRGG